MSSVALAFKAEKYSLPLFHPKRFAVAECLVVYGASAIRDFPTVVSRSFMCQRRYPMMRGQENFLIVISRFSFSFNLFKTKLLVKVLRSRLPSDIACV